jgi:hypothetical protein
MLYSELKIGFYNHMKEPFSFSQKNINIAVRLYHNVQTVQRCAADRTKADCPMRNEDSMTGGKAKNSPHLAESGQEL